VKAHLDTCSKCSAILAGLQKTAILLKNLPEVEPPPWLRQKVMAKIREEAEQEYGLLRKLFYPIHLKIPLGAFATLLVALLGFYIYQSTLPETSTVPLGSQAEIKQAAPRPGTSQIPASTQKDTTETKGRSGYVDIHSREKAYAPPPSVENSPHKEQEQKPSADTPSPIGMAKEKKQAGMYEPARPRPEATRPAEPLAKQKDTLSAAGAAPPPQLSLAEKQAAVILSVQVTDVTIATRQIEKILDKLGARNIVRNSREGKEFINAQLQPEKTKELVQQLRSVGVVQEKEVGERFEKENILFQIEITTNNVSR
jgi:hypothetical protein